MSSKEECRVDSLDANEEDNHSGVVIKMEDDGSSSGTASQQEKMARAMAREVSGRANYNQGTPPNVNMETINGDRDVQLVTKATEQSPQTSKFVGVTVVTNPSEQVTVS